VTKTPKVAPARPKERAAVPADTTATSARPQATKTKPPAAPTATKPKLTPPKLVSITDGFDRDQIDGTIWYPIRIGSGWNMTERDSHLEFAFSADASPGSPYDSFGGHVGTQCKFPGDFDARVDFTLVTWPTGNGIEVALWSFFSPTNEGWQSWRRSAAQWGEAFGSFTGPGSSASVSLNDTSGTLRLARRDGIVTAYFQHNGTWQSLTSGYNTSPATIAVGAGGGDGYNMAWGHQPVVVDLDNFAVNGADPICPPGSQPPGG